MNHLGQCSGVRSIRALNAHGGFTLHARVGWGGGEFTVESGHDGSSGSTPLREQESSDLDGSDLWLIPGLVDAHLHAGWQAFDESDRDQIGAGRTADLITEGLHRTLASGFTSVRDAGGLAPDAIRNIQETQRPRAQTAVELIDRARADTAGSIDAAVEDVLERGARWVKLVATAGVASPAGAGLEPAFTRAETARAAQLAQRSGAGLMVHAWGGDAIDYAIEAGDECAAVSIEHGIFLTKDQAGRAANAGLTLVPTLLIYRLVRDMIAAGSLPAAFEQRVAEAVAAHPGAVRIARDAGLALALGSDYGTAEQHGTGRLEFDALLNAGLTPAEALIAATGGGARLLALVDPDLDEAFAGRILPGAPADGVLLRADPRNAGALSAPDAIAAVILNGRVVAPVTPERNAS